MPTITISRLTGSDNGTFGRELARRLGYIYVDKETIHRAAVAAQANEGDIEAIEELEKEEEAPEEVVSMFKMILKEEKNGTHKPELSGWFKDNFPFEIPNYYDTDYADYRKEIEKAKAAEKPLKREMAIAGYRQIIRHLAERGQVVIVGRGSQAILKDVPWVFHLRLTACRAHRIANVAEMHDMADDKAEKFMDRSDKWRARFIKDNFGEDWSNPELYHLTVSMDRWKSYKLIEAIAAIVESNVFRQTMEDMKKHYRWRDESSGPVRRGI